MPDNYTAFEMHDAESQRVENSRPVCECCRQPIWDEYTWVIDGDYYCDDCARSQFTQDTERIMA